MTPTELKMVEKEFGNVGEFNRQSKIYGQKMAITQALPQLADYRADLQWLKDNYSSMGKA